MLQPNLNKLSNTVKIDIEPGLSVFGNADLLVQVLTNILQTPYYTKNGTVAMLCEEAGNIITAECDTGEGILPELWPHV